MIHGPGRASDVADPDAAGADPDTVDPDPGIAGGTVSDSASIMGAV